MTLTPVATGTLPPSPSYFWSCITLSDACPFFTSVDPNLYYFGIVLISIYGAFLLMIFSDLTFYWSLDNFQHQIDYYINLVTVKVRRVRMDQRRLMTTQERTEKQLKRSQECNQLITALRGALCNNNQRQLALLTSHIDEDQSSTRQATWSDVHSVMDL